MTATENETPTRFLASRIGVLLLALSMAASASAQEAVPPERKENPIADRTDQLVEEITGDDADFGPVTKIEEPAATGDEMGQLRLFAARVLNSQIEVRNEYMEDLQKAGWDLILDPTRLSEDAGMVESKRIIADARSAAEKMCRQMRPRSEAAARAVAAELDLTEAQKRSLVNGYLQGMDRMASTSEELCRLELAILEEIAGAVSVFGRDPGWYPEGEQYMFSEDHYVEEFNARLQAIQALSETQTTLQRKVMTEASAKIRDVGL